MEVSVLTTKTVTAIDHIIMTGITIMEENITVAENTVMIRYQKDRIEIGMTENLTNLIIVEMKIIMNQGSILTEMIADQVMTDMMIMMTARNILTIQILRLVGEVIKTTMMRAVATTTNDQDGTLTGHLKDVILTSLNAEIGSRSTDRRYDSERNSRRDERRVSPTRDRISDRSREHEYRERERFGMAAQIADRRDAGNSEKEWPRRRRCDEYDPAYRNNEWNERGRRERGFDDRREERKDHSSYGERRRNTNRDADGTSEGSRISQKLYKRS